jgi:hypothetical protein
MQLRLIFLASLHKHLGEIIASPVVGVPRVSGGDA